MFRRSIFLSIITLLAFAIFWSVMKPTRKEKGPPQPPSEIVKKSKPSLTRLLNPRDLEIADSNCDLTVSEAPGAKRAGPGKTVSARHKLTIRNSGKVVYRNVLLGFSYCNARGKPLDTRNWLVIDPVMPGESKSISGIGMHSLPGGSAKCAVTILYADMEPSK
jgi:hypothetical protein